MSVVYHIERCLQNEIKTFTYAASNEFEAMPVVFVLRYFFEKAYSLLYGKNEKIQKFKENLPTIFRKITSHEICSKSFSSGFLLNFKSSEGCYQNLPSISQKIILRVLPKASFQAFITIRISQRILSQFWSS